MSEASAGHGHGMNFIDLPEGWDTEPIHTEDRVADILDLLISERDRRAGAVLVVLCDERGYFVVANVVEDLRPPMEAEAKRHLVGVFAAATEQLEQRAGLMVAIARADGLSLTQDDREWGPVVRDVCDAADIELLGVHLVTLHGTRRIAA